MASELIPTSAEVVSLGGGVLVGRALELLLQNPDRSVRFVGEPALGSQELEESGLLGVVPLRILAPGASPRCREAVFERVGSRTVQAGIEILELPANDQVAQVQPRRCLPWPCRMEDLKRQLMATSRDGLGASRDERDSQIPRIGEGR